MSDSRSISFSSRVYDKDGVCSVLDRSFKEFGIKESGSVKRTVPEFFQDYEDLFFEIPVNGETGSHQYLVNKSSQLYKLEESLVDVQPLLDEITQLKAQSVSDQQTIVDLRLKIAELGGTSI